MIKSGSDDRKITPKQKAVEIILNQLESVYYRSEKDPDTFEAMTERERLEVDRQLDIVATRLRNQLRKLLPTGEGGK